MKEHPSESFPEKDFTRIAFRNFTDTQLADQEQSKIFDGPHWCYLGLAIEVPKPGDFIVSYVGRREVVLTRDKDGTLSAFLNSCAHRGAQVVRRLRGNAMTHTCAYHQWCYDTKGALQGVPQLRGIKGKGGMPEDFDKSKLSLQTLRVQEYRGLVFATFSEQVEPLYDYLGEKMRPEVDRIFERTPKLLGYYRQVIPANWKLYVENVKDPYHAGLLHLFHVTFGIYRPTMSGRVTMDVERGHSILRTADLDEKKSDVTSAYSGIDKYREGYKLADASLFDVAPDYGDKVTNMIMTIFPNLMLGQVANTFQTRHVRPRGAHEFELFWTVIGFEADSADATEGRLRQSNFIGPAGYISLEDGEAGRLVQTGVSTRSDAHSFIEMGGRGDMEDIDSLSTEVAVRAFWKRYAKAIN